MLQFDAAPAVPLKYPRLRALTAPEIEEARAAAYVAEMVDPRVPVRRQGLNYPEPSSCVDIEDWRTRMYTIWFCYAYENFILIDKPVYAIEELILEFQGSAALDLPDRRLATLYAGAGGWEPIPPEERTRQLELLKPHYAKAVALLDRWSPRAT